MPLNTVIYLVTIAVLYCGAHRVTIIVVGNGHGAPSSNPGRGCLNFT